MGQDSDDRPRQARMPDGTVVDVVSMLPDRARVRTLVRLGAIRGDDGIVLEAGTTGIACGLWPHGAVPGDPDDVVRGWWHLIAVDTYEGGPWHVPALPDQVEIIDEDGEVRP